VTTMSVITIIPTQPQLRVKNIVYAPAMISSP
jgi:hypothetical protein